MDLLNLGGDERLDLGDLTHATNLVPTGLVNELTGSFLVSAGTNTIISGFRPSGSGQGPVQVGDSGTPNSALLGQRLAGAITQGVFSAVGPQTINLSVSSLPANTYGIFVRFNRLPGVTQTRKFWSKAAPGSEYAQLADTRLVAAWEARLEVSSPSAEWLQIGQVVVTSAGSGQGNTITVTDQRPLYFEGTSAGGYAPTWGTAADRSTNRQTAPIGTLQRQLDALRQCIVDIKGRGLASWYQPNIAGMQIGSGFGLSSAPSANMLAIGDSSFYLSFTPRSGPPPQGLISLAFNGSSDQLSYDRSSGFLQRFIGSQSVLLLTQIGSASFGAGSQLASSRVTVNQAGSGAGSSYGVAVQAGGSSAPPAMGLFSSSGTSAFLELGNQPGSLYGALVTSWAGPVTTQLWANSRAFITGAASGTSTAISLIGNSVSVGSTGAAISVAGRSVAPGGQVWAVGYFSYGQSFAYVSAASGVTATASVDNTNGVTNINFSSAIPTANIVSVTTLFGQGGIGNYQGKSLAPSYQVSGNTLKVQIRNDNSETVATDFSFVVFYGT